MEAKEKKPVSGKKMNLIFVVVVLVLAAALAGWYWLHQKDAHELCAFVQYEGKDGPQQMILPLDEDKTYDIETVFDTVHIQIKDGAAAFVNSPCPDHVCEGFGWLNRHLAFASCVPNGVFLSIEEKGDLRHFQ